MTRTIALAALAALGLPAGLLQGKGKAMKQEFGKMPDGSTISIYTLKNSKGLEARIINYGGTVVSIEAPDRDGRNADVVLGFDNLAGYLGVEPYFGAIIGRYGNRIGHSRFRLDGVEYKLDVNDGANSLHGGKHGFDRRVWDVRRAEGNVLELHYLSKDGEEGYPGNLDVTVRYTLTDDNGLKIDYLATTDKDTVLNLTNHSYFNLAGQGSGNILGQRMMINADRFLPVDKGLIPTGELRPVAGTPFDFRKPEVIGARIGADYDQIKLGGGYDHCFVLNKKDGELSLAARATDPGSGRVLEVWTTEPAVQFYTGNFLDGTITGKQGKVYPKRSAFCLETEHYPDSPNQSAFPSVVLKPGAKFVSTTIYRFSHE